MPAVRVACVGKAGRGSGLLASSQATAQPMSWGSLGNASEDSAISQRFICVVKDRGQDKLLISSVALGPDEKGQDSENLLFIPGLLDDHG